MVEKKFKKYIDAEWMASGYRVRVGTLCEYSLKSIWYSNRNVLFVWSVESMQKLEPDHGVISQWM